MPSLFLIVIFLIVFFNYRNSSSIEGINTTVVNEDEPIEWNNYTAAELGVTISYPNNWKLEYFFDELDHYIEMYSSEEMEYSDALTGQVLRSPLNTITIRKDQLASGTTLIEWATQRVNSDSIQKQEQVSVNGFSAIRQWVWNKQNAFAFSAINYYIQDGDDILSFRNQIMNDNPDSTEFTKAEEIGDEIFSNLLIN